MPSLPAFCATCGRVFRSGISVGAADLSVPAIEVGPCPVCGGIGEIPAGLYHVVDETIHVLDAYGLPDRQTLEVVATILHDAGSDADSAKSAA